MTRQELNLRKLVILVVSKQIKFLSVLKNPNTKKEDS